MPQMVSMRVEMKPFNDHVNGVVFKITYSRQKIEDRVGKTIIYDTMPNIPWMFGYLEKSGSVVPASGYSSSSKGSAVRFNVYDRVTNFKYAWIQEKTDHFRHPIRGKAHFLGDTMMQRKDKYVRMMGEDVRIILKNT